MKIKRVRKVVKPAPWDYRITLNREEAVGLHVWLTNMSNGYAIALRAVLNKSLNKPENTQ